MTKKIALVTVVYKNYDVLKDFFASLNRQSLSQYHVFLADLSEKYAQDIKEKDNLTVIKGENKGYAHGVNLGINLALNRGYDKFCVINPDIVFANNFVENLFNFFSKSENIVFGGKIYYAKGFEYHRDRYSKTDLGNVFWYAGGEVDWNNAWTKHRGVDEVDKNQYSKLDKTEFITGCLICFDKKAFEKVGFWDEKYFMYYEDADFCERAKRQQVDLYYNPNLVIWHKNAQSTEGSGSDFHVKYQTSSQLRWGLKFAPWKTKAHLLWNFIVKYLKP
jgi:hypothetical protein